IALWDGVVMVALFGLYLWFSGRAERVEPELMGPAATVGALAPPRRRVIVVSLFVFAAATILASAEPFAESLLKAGRTLGIDEFVMVQWVAPLASESPEILIAVIFTIKGQVRMAMTALISAEVNQWTLLVGTLPFVYTASLGQFTLLGLPLDARQAEEIWLTAAQSLFAVVLLARLRLNGWAGLALLLLWAGQLGFTTTEARFVFVGLYLAATVGLLALDRGRLGALRRLLPESLKVARGS
ncbi:MAG: sodium:proton exchanger, partial [Chloroflexi bacterium]|nr:sodium:proton exchanger [Chloroflexota bacterium]